MLCSSQVPELEVTPMRTKLLITLELHPISLDTGFPFPKSGCTTCTPLVLPLPLQGHLRSLRSLPAEDLVQELHNDYPVELVVAVLVPVVSETTHTAASAVA